MKQTAAATTRNSMLIIDDDFLNREILKNIFAGTYQFEEAENGLEGLEKVEQHEQELCAILLDVQMPEMNGMELLHILSSRDILSRIPVFLITADEELNTAKTAYDMGVMGVINKPVVPFIVERRIHTVVELFRAREALDDRVRQQEQTIQENVETIDSLHRSTLEAMASAIEFRDVESGEHTNRIYGITKLILQKTAMGLGFTDEEIENIAIGSIMHDVGKIAISDVILNKPGRLTKDEFEAMKLHTVKGYELMARLSQSQDHPSYRYAQDIARHHHERWDGRGYPDGLKGDEISIWSQVVSIADVYDALTSPRVYKKAFSADKAVDMIKNGECGVFNPKLLASFLEIEPELRLLYQQEASEPQAGKDGRITADGCSQTPAPGSDPMDSILLTAAVQQFYDVIICANLSANSFYLLSGEQYQSRTTGKSGEFDDLIEKAAQAVPPSHRQTYWEQFSREKLLAAFAEGKKTVGMEHPQYTDGGILVNISSNALIMEDPRNGNVRSIILIRRFSRKNRERN